jgi:methyl-accepting chemotaxis protein
VQGRDEVSQLAHAFNEMASELRDHVQAWKISGSGSWPCSASWRTA